MIAWRLLLGRSAPWEDKMKRPRDPIQLGKLIVDMSVDDVPVDHGKPDAPVPEPDGPAKGGAGRSTTNSLSGRTS